MLVIPFVLTGCSLFSPVEYESPKKYTLSELPEILPSTKTYPLTLHVFLPETQPIYNTTKMAYTIQPHQIAFFGYNEWAETPSEIFYPLIIKTFQNTHYFQAVVGQPYNGHYDYGVSTQILDLRQDLTLPCPSLSITIRVQVSDGRTKKILATNEFTILEPLLRITPYDGVIAANHAVAKILDMLTNFTLSVIQRRF